MKKTKRTITKLQQAPEATRIVWLWILMAIAAFVVISVWLVSFNIRIARVSTDGIVGARSAPTFLSIVSAGTETIAREAAQGMALILQSRTVEVSAERPTFIYEGVEKTSIVALP